PATIGRGPAGCREVVERDDGPDPLFVAGGAHTPVVLEGHARPLALFRLDAAPLEREAVAAEAEVGQHPDVVGVAVPVVARVAARLDARRAGVVLPLPPVVVPVGPVDLVCRRGGAPHKTLRERRHRFTPTTMLDTDGASMAPPRTNGAARAAPYRRWSRWRRRCSTPRRPRTWPEHSTAPA